jgi:hypothetical protein
LLDIVTKVVFESKSAEASFEAAIKSLLDLKVDSKSLE